MAGGGAHPRRVWRTGRKPITGSLALERLAAAQAARRGGTGGAGRSRPWGGDRRARVSAPAHHSRHMPKETICRRNRENRRATRGPLWEVVAVPDICGQISARSRAAWSTRTGRTARGFKALSCRPLRKISCPCIHRSPRCRLVVDRPLRRSGRRLRAAVDMCSPVQFIPALREGVACGFTMPVRYDGEICR